MRLAIIPARGGSKRIPRKNIRNFCGKPIIAYAIGAAIESGLFAHILVSTDDNEIAEIARHLGAETPFQRPSELADDHTPTIPVIAHAINQCEALGLKVDNVCCIYPSVPFIKVGYIKAALDLLEESKAAYCFPVTEFPSAIQRALRRAGDGRTSPFYPEHVHTRTQDLEHAYYDTGQFYWGTRKAWLSNDHIHSSGVGLIIPQWHVVDIDTADDWRRAEIIHKSLEITEN